MRPHSRRSRRSRTTDRIAQRHRDRPRCPREAGFGRHAGVADVGHNFPSVYQAEAPPKRSATPIHHHVMGKRKGGKGGGRSTKLDLRSF